MSHHTWREGAFYATPAIKSRDEREILQVPNF